jgi:hypothetical protein
MSWFRWALAEILSRSAGLVAMISRRQPSSLPSLEYLYCVTKISQLQLRKHFHDPRGGNAHSIVGVRKLDPANLNRPASPSSCSTEVGPLLK